MSQFSLSFFSFLFFSTNRNVLSFYTMADTMLWDADGAGTLNPVVFNNPSQMKLLPPHEAKFWGPPAHFSCSDCPVSGASVLEKAGKKNVFM